MRRYGLLLALAGLVLPSLLARAGAEVEEVEQCLRRNLPQRTSMDFTLRPTDRTGGERSLTGKLYWKLFADDRLRTLIQLDGPPDLRGSSCLLLERKGGLEVFVYLPELKRVRRITPHAMSGSLFGTDFSYEDFRFFQRLGSDVVRERLPDTQIGERPAFVLRITPAPEDAAVYDQVVAFVDRETCVQLKVEFYTGGEAPRKVLTVDPSDIRREGDRWVAQALRMRDLRNETETQLVVEKLEIDPDLPDRLFSQSALARGH